MDGWMDGWRDEWIKIVVLGTTLGQLGFSERKKVASKFGI